MSNLTILDTSIRSQENLFSLNDLHRASGAEDKHRPTLFMRNQQTKELIDEINFQNTQRSNSISGKTPHLVASKIIRGGADLTVRGYWVCEELVLSYAMWISPKFHLVVLRAFLAMHRNEPKQLALSETLTPEEQRQIQNAVKATHERTGLSYGEIWARAKNKFNVAKYEQIPRSQLRDVLIYIASMSAIAVKNPTLSYSLLYPLALLYYYSAEFHDSMVKQKAEEPKMWGLLNRQCRTMDRVRLAISMLAEELPDPEHKADILAFLEP
ncbi:KilA-N domain-containing protein [Rodentibacter rarus]|uniref:KilA-N domain-containing protein n=1 Tax=Rodentibacter rarus TaxID=1908260 RepID=UPI0009852E8A|nr:KilA-N domain-containing protein [Rodentibacter rarus]